MQRIAPILLLIGSLGLGALLWGVFGTSSRDSTDSTSQFTLDPLDLEYEEVFPGGADWLFDSDEEGEDDRVDIAEETEGESTEDDEDAQIDQWLGSKLEAAATKIKEDLLLAEGTQSTDDSEITSGSPARSALTQEVEGILAELREKRSAARKISKERKKLKNLLKVLKRVARKLKIQDHDKQRLQELTLENRTASQALKALGLPKAENKIAIKELNERFKQDVSRLIGEDTSKKYIELTKRFSDPNYATKKKFRSLTNRIKKLEKLVTDLTKGGQAPPQ